MSTATAHTIDGKALAAELRADVATRAAAFSAATGRSPGLATLLVGDDPASAVYVASKHRACEQAGIRSFDLRLAATATRDEVLAVVEQLNVDPQVDGILCQLPLPDHLDGVEVTGRVRVTKDVDGLTPESIGRLTLGLPGLRPCTPAGAMRLLAAGGAELAGADAVVIGRSNLFGKPMAQLLNAADATVTLCHSRTRDLAAACRRADVLVAAVGHPRLVRGDWVKPGAVVIDVGINRVATGLVGDVDFEEVAAVASAVTPVPGGVGPMTIACLLENTMIAAERSAQR